MANNNDNLTTARVFFLHLSTLTNNVQQYNCHRSVGGTAIVSTIHIRDI
jgi:hypothetical protein